MEGIFGSEREERARIAAPLAERMRPADLSGFFGQDDILGEGGILRLAIENDEVPSMILWGPPGCGKTSLARVIANITKSAFIKMSAAGGSVKEAREIIAEARERLVNHGSRTILFVDEIHRFSKSQQDTFLPHVEAGTVTFIGATTENPSFEVNSALLSRCRVFVLKKLEPEKIEELLLRAISDRVNGLGSQKIKISDGAIKFIAAVADGDARSALNALELAIGYAKKDAKGKINIKEADIEPVLGRSSLLYDKNSEEHYNIISALHKSMRGGDADAALYWMGRMLEAGEDPLYVARRLIRFASEDIGLANPAALTQAVAAYNAAHFLGMPECNVNLAQAVAYLAKSPKSNALYAAYNKIQKDIKDLPNEGVPLHLRNAPTKLMKDLNYGKDYKYNPNFKVKVEQDYLPEKLKGRKYLDS